MKKSIAVISTATRNLLGIKNRYTYEKAPQRCHFDRSGEIF